MLTVRQKQVLEFINESIQFRGYPPTFREIGHKMGIKSTNGVNDHLKALERKGYLQRDDLKSRALRPLKDPEGMTVSVEDENSVWVPVLGKCAAGAPILATENVEDTVQVSRFFLGSHREVFALRIQGDSMVDAGIFNGDYVFVRRQPTAHSGDIVVAMINDEATVKYFYPEHDRVLLKPANQAFQPIVVPRNEFKPINILGTVVGVYRRFV